MAAKFHLWDPWKSAQSEPGRIAVASDGGDRIDYARLVRDADRIGSALTALALPDGARISTDLRAGPEMFALALAALKFGFGLFPVNQAFLRDGAGYGSSLCRQAKTILHVGDGPSPIEGPQVDYRELVAWQRETAPDAPRAGFLIFATSGTTSGEHTVIAQPRPRHPYQGVGVFARYSAGRAFGPHIMGNPTFHLGTLGPALYAVQAGSGAVVAHDWSAERMNELIREHAAASAFLSVDRLTDYVLSADQRSGLTSLFHGGSSCPPWVKRRAIEIHGPVLHEYYGTSEGVVTEISSTDWLTHPGSVGRPVSGMEVVVRQDEEPLAANTAGEIYVRSLLPDRKMKEPLRTGDLGYLDPDGYLHVLGRISASSGTVEAVAEHRARSVAGVRDVVAVADSGVTCLVEAPEDESAALFRSVRAAIEDGGGPPCDVVIFPPGTLTRTETGKLSRVAARRLVAQRRGFADATV